MLRRAPEGGQNAVFEVGEIRFGEFTVFPFLRKDARGADLDLDEVGADAAEFRQVADHIGEVAVSGEEHRPELLPSARALQFRIRETAAQQDRAGPEEPVFRRRASGAVFRKLPLEFVQRFDDFRGGHFAAPVVEAAFGG